MNYNNWSWDEKKALLIKVIEWAQRNRKNVYSISLNELLEAVKYK